MKNILFIPLMAIALSGCFDKESGKPVDPETMADCIAIENPNDRDICEMKLNEKSKEKRKESLGDGELPELDW